MIGIKKNQKMKKIKKEFQNVYFGLNGHWEKMGKEMTESEIEFMESNAPILLIDENGKSVVEVVVIELDLKEVEKSKKNK